MKRLFLLLGLTLGGLQADTCPTTPTTACMEVTDLTGSPQTNRPFWLSVHFVEGEIASYPQPIYNGTPVGTWQSAVLTRWPGGSVRNALVDFNGTLNASATAAITFQNAANPCSAGNQAACEAAGLNSLALLLDPGWLSGSPKWNAQIDTTGISATINARTMLGTLALAGNKIRFRRIGPVLTEAIIEDRSTALTYDFGSDANKSLHPRFIVTFINNWQGFKVEFSVENDWHTKRQQQTYAFSLKTAINGAGLAEVFAKASFVAPDSTRWRQVHWVGSNPEYDGSNEPKININHNRAYWTMAKVIPNYDPAMVPSASAVSSALSVWNATDKCAIASGYGQFEPNMSSGGGREEIGLTTTWEARWLMTMHIPARGKDMFKIVLGHVPCQSNSPIHIRESNAAKASFGNWLDINDETPMTGAGCLSTCGGAVISPDLSHFPPFGYIPWLATGDLWHLEELQATASWAWTNLNESSTLSYGRGGTIGMLTQTVQVRGVAWGIRSMGQAATATPDADSLAKTHYTNLVNNNIAAYEGKLNITTSPFFSNTAWDFGHDVVAPNADSGHCSPACGRIPNPLGFMMYDSSPAGSPADFGINSNSAFQDLTWKMGYLHAALGQLKQFGFATQYLHAELSKEIINNTLNPTITNPYLQGGYMAPRIDANDTFKWFQTWGAYWGAYTAAQKAKTSWAAVAPSSHDGDCDNGYPHLLRGGAAFIVNYSDGSYTGQATYDWLNANVGRGCQPDNPKWAFIPDSGTPPPPPPTLRIIIIND